MVSNWFKRNANRILRPHSASDRYAAICSKALQAHEAPRTKNWIRAVLIQRIHNGAFDRIVRIAFKQQQLSLTKRRLLIQKSPMTQERRLRLPKDLPDRLNEGTPRVGASLKWEKGKGEPHGNWSCNGGRSYTIVTSENLLFDSLWTKPL